MSRSKRSREAGHRIRKSLRWVQCPRVPCILSVCRSNKKKVNKIRKIELEELKASVALAPRLNCTTGDGKVKNEPVSSCPNSSSPMVK
ncbi:hypothetical protein VNO78_35268 [Psophocarpus tetragonolobus]|uniref:Uncharacterized protein n=1 Tax=Psophocarpus tetragonolobus TaxID=3891 RepID=A0AAN9NUA8_PSOTE